MKSQIANHKSKILLGLLSVMALAIFGLAATRITSDFGAVIETPTITITTATADTTAGPTTGATDAHIYWKFATVAGTYTTCTVQALTSYDGGANYVNLGGASALTVTTGTLNAWAIYELPLTGAVAFPADTTGVAVTPVSTNTGTGFGQLTKYTFACSGAYGTSAPVTVTVVYR